MSDEIKDMNNETGEGNITPPEAVNPQADPAVPEERRETPVAPAENATESETPAAEPARAGYSSYASGEYAGAGVGERFTVERSEPQPQSTPQQNTQSTPKTAYTGDSGTGNTPPSGNAYHPGATYTQSSYHYAGATEPKKAPKTKRERRGMGAGAVALLLIACLVLGAGAGFGGAVLYNSVFADANTGIGGSGGSVNINKVESNGVSIPEDGSLTDVIASVAGSVVEIRTEAVVTGSFFGNYVSEGAGSGVIISADGYIITNNHVISDATTITVRTKGGDEYTAELIATDTQTDIAVIKVNATDLQAATIGVSADLVVGERAIAIGNPLGELGGSVTLGYISALDREITVDGTQMTLLQTDAAINPGNSGGALFNAKGELIGIVNAKSAGDSIEGLGFAIPVDTAISVATDLIENGHVSGRPALGVQVAEIADSNDYYQYRSSELGEYIDTYGVYIVSDSQGNFQLGDRIVAIEGTSVSSLADITEILNGREIGDTVTVTYSRSRRMAEAAVTLVERTE